jgi:hypothetical protein
MFLASKSLPNSQLWHQHYNDSKIQEYLCNHNLLLDNMVIGSKMRNKYRMTANRPSDIIQNCFNWKIYVEYIRENTMDIRMTLIEEINFQILKMYR